MKIISIEDLMTDFYCKSGKLVGIIGRTNSHNIIANLSKMGLGTVIYGVCGIDSVEKIGS